MDSVYLKPWYLYILLCNDDSLYTGITPNLETRYLKHQSGKGAKYTKSRGVKAIVYFEEFENYKLAAMHEAQIKKLSRKQKVDYIQSKNR